MNYIIILWLLMLLIFTTYVAFIYFLYGVQKSISQSYYCLPAKSKLLFTLFCWCFAFPAIIVADNLLMFIAGSGICFVGAAASFQDKLTRPVHMIGAGIGVVFSQLSIIFDYHLWYISLIFVVTSILLILFRKQVKQHQIWWIEIVAFLSICLVLWNNLSIS
jgi:hypothetical protein